MTPISARVAKVLSTVQGIKAAGLSYATSARQAASVAYWSLKEKGLKAYSAETAAAARARASVALTDAKTLAQAKAKLTRAKAVELKVATGELVASKSFQATAASATGGATMLGAGGGAAGLAVGGVTGALAGLPLALFTFGLSVPAGAVFGGGAGLAIGAATGASIGAVGGGVAGFGAYSKRNGIRQAASLVASTVGDGAVYAKGKASQSRMLLQSTASAARARLFGAKKVGPGDEKRVQGLERDMSTRYIPHSLEVRDAAVCDLNTNASASNCRPMGKRAIAPFASKCMWNPLSGLGPGGFLLCVEIGRRGSPPKRLAMYGRL